MKILILYANAGGGHKTIAKVLESELKANHQVQIVDVFANSKNFFQKNLGSIYSFLTKEGTWFWYLFILLLRQKWFEKLAFKIFFLTSKNLVKDIFEDKKPEMVISTYYFLTQISYKLNPNLKTWCIVADLFSPEKVWFSDLSCKYLVFSNQSMNIGLKNGVSRGNLIQIPPITLNFGLIQKEEINISKTKQKTILLLGGGEGLKNYFKITKLLLKNSNYKILAVCGRDQRMFEKLKILSGKNSNLEVFGFVNFVAELIQKSDLVISKAGPNTVLEILSFCKPVFLCDYIWPQEMGVVDFVVKNNFGIYEKKPLKLTSQVKNFFSEPEKTVFNKTKIEFGNKYLKNIFDS